MKLNLKKYLHKKSPTSKHLRNTANEKEVLRHARTRTGVPLMSLLTALSVTRGGKPRTV